MRKIGLLCLLSILSIILVACGGEENTESEKPSLEISDDEKVADDEIVAIIDGEEITGAFYNEVYIQQKAITQDTVGDNYDLEDVKQGTLDSIINDTLILHMGDEEGIVITDETIAEELKELKKVGADGYNTLKEQFHYTDEAIEHLLRVEYTVKEYMEKHIEVEVTDEEIEALYEEAKASGDEIPSLDEARKELEEVVEINKSKEEVRKHIASYKKSVDLEINI